MSKSKTSSPAVDRGLEVERVEVSTLLNDPANVRKHNERNLESIKASLARFGQQKPIVVGRDGVVIAGNGTLAAARSLGWSMIDIVRSHLTGAEATAYAIADNRTAELAEWDEESLAQQLAALQIEDEELLAATGFDEKELEAMSGPAEVEEDEVPEPPVDPITKPGDLWILGEHRLLCGDSTKADDVERLMDGENPRLMVTDPPYGVAYEGGQVNTKKRERLQNDDVPDVFAPALKCARKMMAEGAWYVWHAGTSAEPVHAAIKECGFDIRALIVWHKLKAHYAGANAHYCQKHEPCLYAVKGSANFVGPSNEVTVWEIDQPSRNEFHPTQKPIECMARAIRNHDAPLIYDPFLGSGTTLIAAEQLGRKCYGMEISPAYCDVIVKRWETLTGKKAERGA
jgi:DNA modification methylase